MANKSTLIETVHAAVIADGNEKFTKKQAKLAVEAMLEDVKEALVQGESVNLIKFGTFSVKDRAARKGRNPQTGEEIVISARKMPAFKPADELKKEINAE